MNILEQMEHFYIITNQLKDPEYKTTYWIRDYLEGKDKRCTLQGSTDKAGEGYTDQDWVPQDVDCILVLGGDGTLLQAAVDLADRDIPFLGINFGKLGFLAEVEKTDIENALNRLINGDYGIENRMMILGEIYDSNGKIEDTKALNDIVISRKGSLKIVSFSIYVNGQFLNRYNGDGVILSTPTGSTGYNLSVGGPIVEPGAQMILVSPISPHSMQSRSIVLSAEDEIIIEIGSSREGKSQEVEVIFDGSHKVCVCTGETVKVCKSDKTTAIVKLSKDSFLTILHKKMAE